MFNKKGISPVVATALLLVVAVVAVLGFQNWFGMYSSDIFVKTEKESQDSTFFDSIETIVGNQLYVKGKVGENLTIKQILVDGNDCGISLNVSGVTNISLGSCLTSLSTSTPEIVLITEDKIITKKIYLKDVVISNQEISQDNLESSLVYTNTFISVWNTSVSGISGSNQIQLPLESSGTYNFIVTSENLIGSPITIISESQKNLNFSTEGIQKINITGVIKGWRFNNGGDKNKILDIKAWGPLNLGNSGSYFYGCSNLHISANDSLNLNGTNSFYQAFRNTINLGEVNFSNWDTSNITTMANMFQGATSFNSDLSLWDVSKVNSLWFTFSSASSFDSDLSLWDVSEVIYMYSTFSFAVSFNSNLNNWDVSKVTTMIGMFRSAENFNSNLNNWNVSNVEYMSYMFHRAWNFEGNISNWDVSKVKSMDYMFVGLENFTNDLSSWNTNSVTSMYAMFAGASNFNSNLSTWDVDQVTSCSNFNSGTPSWILPKPNFTSCSP